MAALFAAFLMWTQLAAPETASLDALIRTALERNPEIQAAARRWEAAATRPSQVSAPPNPTISLGYWNAGSVLPGTSLGENEMSFVEPMVMQRFPFPGKLGLRGQIAQKEADSTGRMYDAVRLRVAADVKRAYFDLYQVDRSIETIERNRELLNRFTSVARSLYEVGSGLQQDVLKAQVEETLLEGRLSVLRRQRGAMVAHINQLLHQPPDTPLPMTGEASVSSLDYTPEQLYAIAEEANPVLDARRIDIERSARVLDLAEKEHLPDIGLKVGRMFMGRFDDMWNVSVEAEVPLFFWRKERRGVEEAAIGLRQSRNEYESTGQALFREVTDHYLSAQTATRLERLYREAVVPQASLALESSLSAYQVGNLDFLAVMDNWEALLDFELDYYTQVAEHEKALANLEQLTGLTLIESGGAE